MFVLVTLEVVTAVLVTLEVVSAVLVTLELRFDTVVLVPGVVASGEEVVADLKMVFVVLPLVDMGRGVVMLSLEVTAD
jgi:hypothetical protein